MKWFVEDGAFDDFSKWRRAQDDLVVARQKEQNLELSFPDIPYYGAIGGEVTYRFLGLEAFAEHGVTNNKFPFRLKKVIDLSPIEQNKFDAWKKRDLSSYEFYYTPTSLGCILVVKDTENNEELDLTDYEDW